MGELLIQGKKFLTHQNTKKLNSLYGYVFVLWFRSIFQTQTNDEHRVLTWKIRH